VVCTDVDVARLQKRRRSLRTYRRERGIDLVTLNPKAMTAAEYDAEIDDWVKETVTTIYSPWVPVAVQRAIVPRAHAGEILNHPLG